MHHLAGDLLPLETVGRESKAAFGDAVWLEQARAFADGWDGRGLDPELVDPEPLRATWRAEYPMFHSWSMLHEAWLASEGHDAEQDAGASDEGAAASGSGQEK
jgi:asparagine synthase (glutamine-hydrolysing)